jgi:hypothetical protein
MMKHLSSDISGLICLNAYIAFLSMNPRDPAQVLLEVPLIAT